MFNSLICVEGPHSNDRLLNYMVARSQLSLQNMDHESGTLSNGNMALTSTNNDDGSLKVCARWLIENFCLNTYMMERNERISFGPRFEDLHSRFQFQLTLNWHIKQFKLKIRKHLPGVAYRCRINLSGVCRCVLDHPDLEYDAERGLTIDWIPESHSKMFDYLSLTRFA
ncbi:hypothetical protein D918_07054 [Trichuris suis]|nr:hypothetical protein D918_07054 [Trichuris suis]